MSSVGRSIDSQILDFKSTSKSKNNFLSSSLIEICPVGATVDIKQPNNDNLTMLILLLFSAIYVFGFYFGVLIYFIQFFFELNRPNNQKFEWSISFVFYVTFFIMGFLLTGYFPFIYRLFFHYYMRKIDIKNIVFIGEILEATKAVSKVFSNTGAGKAVIKYLPYNSPPEAAGVLAGVSMVTIGSIEASSRAARILERNKQIYLAEKKSKLSKFNLDSFDSSNVSIDADGKDITKYDLVKEHQSNLENEITAGELSIGGWVSDGAGFIVKMVEKSFEILP
jgi:hypothetical protein